MAEPVGAAPGGYLLPRDTLVVRGPDRKSWLDGLLTCAVAEVAPGTARYGLLLTKQGKIVSDVLLADSGAQLFVGVAPGHGPAVHALLDRYLVMEDAELVLPDSAPAWLLWVGAEPRPQALAFGDLALRDLSASLLVVERAPAEAFDAARLAALLAHYGFGAFGTDFGERDNPHEASLDRVAVSWSKGCYLGQEVVCMQDMRGKVKRRLVALAGDAALLPAPGEAFPSVVAGNGETVGQVTSIHPSSGGACLLASVASSALDSPGQLSVLGRPVRVVTSPSP